MSINSYFCCNNIFQITGKSITKFVLSYSRLSCIECSDLFVNKSTCRTFLNTTVNMHR